MATRSERYAAKMAYQLCLMRGKTTSYQCGHICRVDFDANCVYVQGKAIPIAKSWIYL